MTDSIKGAIAIAATLALVALFVRAAPKDRAGCIKIGGVVVVAGSCGRPS